MIIMPSPFTTPPRSRSQSPDFRTTCLSVSPDGNRVWLGDVSGQILEQLFYPEQKKEIFQLEQSNITSCIFSANGTLAVITSTEGKVCVWDVQTKTVLSGRQEAKYITACSVSTDGKQIIYVSYDRCIRIWDIESFSKLDLLTGHGDAIQCCALSANQKFFVSGSFDNTLIVWDMSSQGILAILNGHKAGVQSCAIHPNNEWIVSGDDRGVIILWNQKTGQPIFTVPGHEGRAVTSIEFSRDGNYILSYSVNAIKIWDSKSLAQPLAVLTCALNSIKACAFMPDNLYIVTSSFAGKIRRWNIAGLIQRGTVNAELTIREYHTRKSEQGRRIKHEYECIIS